MKTMSFKLPPGLIARLEKTAKERRKAGAKLTVRRNCVRIDACQGRAAARQPRKHDRREQGTGELSRTRAEKSNETFRVNGQIGAVPARPLDAPVAVDARPDELNRIGFNRRDDDNHVADECRRDRPA